MRVSKVSASEEFDVLNEVEKSKKIVPAYYEQSTLRPVELTATPSFRVSSISKPSLDSPKDVQRRMVESAGRFYDLGEQIVETTLETLHSGHERQAKIHENFLQKMKEAADKAADISYWNNVQNIAVCFSSATTAILGTTIIAGGGSALIGGLMITAGIGLFMHTALNNLGVYDKIAEKLSCGNEKAKEMIRSYLPGALGLLCVGACFAGAGVSLAAGSLSSLQSVLTTVSSLSNFASGFAQIKKGFGEKTLKECEADKQILSDQLSLQKEDMSTLLAFIESTMRSISESMETTKEILKLSISANQSINI